MRGYILIILAAILWGTTGTSQALAPAGATPLAVGAMRLLVGGSALMLLSISRGTFKLTPDALRTWMKPATLFVGLSVALYQLTFFAGVALTGVAVGTIIAIGSAPIFAGILGYIVQNESLSRRWFIATGLAIFGCVMLAFAGDDSMQVNPLGMLLALGAGLSYAVFALINKQLLEHHTSDAAMAVSFSLGAILLLPILFFVDVTWVASTGGLVVVLHLGLLATGLAYLLFGQGLELLPVSIVGTLSLVEPLTATVLGVVVVGEHLTLMALLGLIVLFLGLVVLVTKPRMMAD